jgi:asparagine synthase (glutamine-hydrolysing)
MAVSLEVRAPLLDHRIVEFAATLPLTMKLRGEQGKWLLRKLLYQHVPQQLVERPKMGFGIPVEAWLRGPLRGWAENLLDPVRLRQEGLLNGELIRGSWENFIAGRGAMELLLWDVLIFQAWLSREQEHVKDLEYHSAA